MWVELSSAVGTVVAAGAACVAVLVSIRQQVQAQRRGMLRDRLTEVTALLAAFEEVAMQQRTQQRIAWAREAAADSELNEGMASEAQHAAVREPNDQGESDRAIAQLTARLYASAELLPINRGTVFGHWPYGAADAREKAHLDRSPMLGDPEIDEEMTMHQRAELVEAVTRLRKTLDLSHIRKADMPRSESHPLQ